MEFLQIPLESADRDSVDVIAIRLEDVNMLVFESGIPGTRIVTSYGVFKSPRSFDSILDILQPKGTESKENPSEIDIDQEIFLLGDLIHEALREKERNDRYDKLSQARDVLHRLLISL